MPRILISLPDKAPQPYRFPLDREFIHIGQGPDNDIIIDSSSVSGDHCVIERVEGGFIIRDKGSTNGIKQDDVPLEIADLFDQSKIHIGDIPLEFQLSEEEIEIISEEDFTSHLKYGKNKKSPEKTSLNKKKQAPKKESASINILDVGDIEEPAELPKKALPPTPTANYTKPISSPQLIHTAPPTSPSTIILLGVCSLVVGMCIRHQLDTGKFLLTEVLLKITGS